VKNEVAMRERNIEEFNRDVAARGGYAYSSGDRLSCRLSNQRMTQAILKLGQLKGKRVLDIGCGDGTFSLELERAGAAEVLGVDAAQAAVESARLRAEGTPNVRFEVADIYSLEEPRTPWDLAVVRGLLHHLYDVESAIARICRVAPEIVVVEPNGYNPILKIIERVSPYHVEHEEKSYPPRHLDRWFQKHGGRVTTSLYIGLVPMFCPDFLARLCKTLEPAVERTPLVRKVACAQYAQRIAIDQTASPVPVE
jgi:2-polyprenyl-3-methyl-5-hydroxy-6-metoxy-1,4-benzoquinol methylase